MNIIEFNADLIKCPVCHQVLSEDPITHTLQCFNLACPIKARDSIYTFCNIFHIDFSLETWDFINLLISGQYITNVFDFIKLGLSNNEIILSDNEFLQNSVTKNCIIEIKSALKNMPPLRKDVLSPYLILYGLERHCDLKALDFIYNKKLYVENTNDRSSTEILLDIIFHLPKLLTDDALQLFLQDHKFKLNDLIDLQYFNLISTPSNQHYLFNIVNMLDY